VSRLLESYIRPFQFETHHGGVFLCLRPSYFGCRTRVRRRIAAWNRQLHNGIIGRDAAEQSSPDLFSSDTARNTSQSASKPPAVEAKAGAAPQRHVLPKNLRDAVEHLSDAELDSLHAAALGELKRRGRFPKGIPAASDKPIVRPKGAPTKRLRAIAEVSLTRGQVNAVRAAFKAGITPSRIARQFGISQSNVRKALAADESER
jgi:predicted DNA-binding protein (UPF0251 family)